MSRSRVTRWLQGAGIDPMNAERVDLLELVWSSLLRLYEPEASGDWPWTTPRSTRQPPSSASASG